MEVCPEVNPKWNIDQDGSEFLSWSSRKYLRIFQKGISQSRGEPYGNITSETTNVTLKETMNKTVDET